MTDPSYPYPEVPDGIEVDLPFPAEAWPIYSRWARAGGRTSKSVWPLVQAVFAAGVSSGRAQSLFDVGEAMSPTGEWPPEALGEVVDVVRELVARNESAYERGLAAGRAQAAADIRAEMASAPIVKPLSPDAAGVLVEYCAQLAEGKTDA